MLGGVLLVSVQSQENTGTILTIATGGTTGVYYPVGSAICQQVNEQTAQHGLRCGVINSAGSIENLRLLRSEQVELAMVQSDWQYHAYLGSGVFSHPGPDLELRALFSLYTEAFTVVARTDTDIRSFEDLRGKRVNIGAPGSGQRATMQVVLKAMGWTVDDLGEAAELPVAMQATLMCDDELDAVIFVGGHPNRSVLEATTLCDAKIVEVSNPAIYQLIDQQPYYADTVIPGGMYRNNPDDIKSFGVTAILATHSSLPEQVAYDLVASVFDDLPAFKNMHPSLAMLEAKDMAFAGLTVPLHAGAERYFKQAGLLSEQIPADKQVSSDEQAADTAPMPEQKTLTD